MTPRLVEVVHSSPIVGGLPAEDGRERRRRPISTKCLGAQSC